MRAPDFWDQKSFGLLPMLMRPVGRCVAGLAAWRQKYTTPWKANVPIICVGNLVAGGAGKTPVALNIAARLKSKNINVHVVMRGYGGTEIGPVPVDTKKHSFRQVGDESLMLAKIAPTWVSRDRKAGVAAATDVGAEIIILDDGFQNPSVHKDFSILVVDGKYGFGNGRVMPAGPLRESINAGLKRAHCIALLGTDRARVKERVQKSGFQNLPVLHARIEPTAAIEDLKDKDVYAFAGIGRPQKFFDTLTHAGCKLIGCKIFDDHHPYTDTEIQTILRMSETATIVTTTKDWVRLSPDHQKKIHPVPISLVWENDDEIQALLDKVLINVR